MSEKIPLLARPVAQRPYLMRNEIQPYEWGTRDRAAFIPALLGFEPEQGRPYAELWMGAHPKAPSLIALDGGFVRLDEWIAVHPVDILGQEVWQRFGPHLPFLAKVLSIGEALSIQAHPDKAQAVRLHARDPEHYPDDNHKPELAVALDSLSSLIGVKPISGLLEALDLYPEMAHFIGKETVERFRQVGGASPPERSRWLFTGLLRRSETQPAQLAAALDGLADRLSDSPSLSEPEALFLNLRRNYPGPDVGLFYIFLLNLMHLTEGQGVYLPAGVPHAYLKGNLFECMANSDNVVRVGLTTKFKDAEALLEIMDYEPGIPQVQDAGPGAGDARYSVSSGEFQVSRFRLVGGSELSLSTRARPGILLVTAGQPHLAWETGSGHGEFEMNPGRSAFLPAVLERARLVASGPVEVFWATIPGV